MDDPVKVEGRMITDAMASPEEKGEIQGYGTICLMIAIR